MNIVKKIENYLLKEEKEKKVSAIPLTKDRKMYEPVEAYRMSDEMVKSKTKHKEGPLVVKNSRGKAKGFVYSNSKGGWHFYKPE